jgi:cytosine/adenosine deaminase-related metal-dependent hydrolase
MRGSWAGRSSTCTSTGGRFVSGGEPRRTIDVEGRLVTPPLVDCHLHLDASLTVGRPRFNENGTLIEGIHVWGELKPSLTEDDVVARASDPNSRFLEVMADDTVKHGLAGRVTASHCTAMGSYEPYYSSKLRGFLKRSGINVVVNPYANSLIQGRLDPYPKRRGFAQLKELLAEGVNVSLGNDVIMDPWYSLGKADLVDAAHLALHFTYMSGRDEIAEMLRCATERGAHTLGVEDEYGLEEGKPADCVVFDAPDALEVIRLRATRRWVLRRGRVIAETTPAETRLDGAPVSFAP